MYNGCLPCEFHVRRVSEQVYLVTVNICFITGDVYRAVITFKVYIIRRAVNGYFFCAVNTRLVPGKIYFIRGVDDEVVHLYLKPDLAFERGGVGACQ